MSNQHQLERELEEFLTQSRLPIVDLYSKLPQPQPNAQLDQQVLKQARQALVQDAAKPAQVLTKPAARRIHTRWPIALSSAASVVFAAGLALHFGMENWRAQENSPASTTSSSATKVGQVHRSDSPEPKIDTNEATPAQTSSPSAPAAEAVKPETTDAAALNDATYMHKELSVDQVSPATPSPSDTTQKLEEPPPSPNTAQGSAAPLSPPAASAPITEFARDPEATDKRTQPAFPQTSDERQRTMMTDRAATLRTRNAEATKPQIAGAMQKSAAPAAATSLAMPKSAPTPTNAAVATVPTAEAWIAKIRAMVQAGQHEQAISSLKQLHEKYPNYPLPLDLRPLLP